MEHTFLGSTDIEISRICMGCMGFGDPQTGMHRWTLDEEASRAIIKQGLDAGINFFDTAIAYQGGTSEQFVGRALNDFAKRSDVVIATKFLPRPAEDIENGVSGQKHIHNSIEQSLRNLEMEYVDLYVYHMWDWQTPIEDIMEGLHQVVQAGKARAIGISNCFAWQIADANAFARYNNLTEFSSVQGHYNLIFREEEREMVPYTKQHNISLTPYSALAGGRLAKRPGETSQRLQQDTFAAGKYDASAEQDSAVISRVSELADIHGVSMTQISLAWLLTKVDSPVVGATKASHVEGAVAATELSLTAEELSYLEQPYQPHPLVGVMAQN